MKKHVLEGNLQILLRSQQPVVEGKRPRKQDAVSVFFDPKPCDDLYPETVDCPQSGKWKLVHKGSQKQIDRQYKVWAIYTRDLPTAEDKEDVEEEAQSEQLP